MKSVKSRDDTKAGATPGDHGDLTIEALTIRYAVLKSFEMLDELPGSERARVSLLLARDLAAIARATGVSRQEEIAALSAQVLEIGYRSGDS